MKQNGIEKRFVLSKDMGALAEEWQKESKDNEPAGKEYSEFSIGKEKEKIYRYTVTRSNEQISKFHGEWIIEDVIPKLLEKLKQGEKLKILDIGAGPAIFSDEIRKKFGDKVEVYSTGLSKRAAREYRKREELPKLHNNDLKWRSIQELSDFPEFGLIIDTYGELYYRLIKGTSDYYNNLDSFPPDWFKHIEQVIKKLLPGGYATLFPFGINNQKVNRDVIKEIREKFNVNAYWKPDSGGLKIEKPE
jgi:hypothetical protein